MSDLIERLYHIKNWKCHGDAEMWKTISDAISVLKNMLSAQPEQAIKDCRNCRHGNYNDRWENYFCYCSDNCNAWDKWEPSAQPEIEQIKWERDTAIQQLRDLGYGLGEKIRTDGDTISRQAAISLPVKPKEDRFFQTQNLDDAYDYGWYDLQRCIEKLPSAQPEQRWIPCSKKLPEKREMVIIWIDMPKQPFIQSSIYMAFAWLEPDARTGELHWMDRHFTKIDDDKVIAWQPLPEPYRGEGDRDDCI